MGVISGVEGFGTLGTADHELARVEAGQLNKPRSSGLESPNSKVFSMSHRWNSTCGAGRKTVLSPGLPWTAGVELGRGRDSSQED